MNEPRKLGLALILLGVIVLRGNTTEALPPEGFFAGLFLYPVGGDLFFKGSRQAINRTEVRVATLRAPKLKNESAERFAQQQRSTLDAHGSVEARIRKRKQKAPDANRDSKFSRSSDERLLLDADSFKDEEDSSVSSYVSFALEVQEHDSLADQIMKLQKLGEDGIISDDEIAVAKSKRLG
ncbi:MAG TPA: hypothetical protein EYG46_20410 [Myxococcales bacterium]|nr:hypothetical protein [Myxococcales bacterium]HIM03348.1 hypothetical protein [Myxococcales bacterium]